MAVDYSKGDKFYPYEATIIAVVAAITAVEAGVSITMANVNNKNVLPSSLVISTRLVGGVRYVGFDEKEVTQKKRERKRPSL
mmetsp:Transcript_22480/g.25129  ORF Transcript_22480/g.25129 Transcript_22480/m.25129 type:complete len:82 (+) Transcript_22480:677-922(+)